MERDIKGTLPKSSSITVKQEPDDGLTNSEAMKGSSLQWSFSKGSTTASQFLSFKSTQEQEGSHKLYPPGFSQRNMSLDKQGGNQYPIVGHRWKPDDLFSTSEAKVFPVAGQVTHTVPATISSSILPSYLTPNVVSSAVGGTSAMSTFSAPHPNCPVVGSTDLKSSPSISSGPCQLTIFYNGSVCVYDNISPEKAQAIMLLAGNGDSTNSSAPATAVPSLPKVQSPMLRLPANDTSIPDLSKGFSSSISLPTPLSSLSAVASSCAANINPITPLVTPNHVKCSETPKSGAPVGPDAVKIIPTAVPQARKASLARFLEKRKERVTAAAPYAVSKNTPESIAANSTSSSPLPASN